jgi:hypothetical protein
VVFLGPPLGVHLGSPALGDTLAKAFATGVGLGWNYLANNFWTFREAAMRGVDDGGLGKPTKVRTGSVDHCVRVTKEHSL